MTKTLDHTHFEELVPAYTIGAADAEDRRMMEEHLAGCAPCCVRLQDYQNFEQEMLFAVKPMSAPFGLTEDLRRRIASSSAQVAPPRTRSSVLRHPLAWLGFAALALLILTNLYWADRVGRMEREAAVLAAIAEAPGITLERSAELSKGNGVFYLPTGANKGLLCVYYMPRLPDDRTYQAWLVRDEQRTSAGTFRVNDDGYGVLLVDADEPLDSFDSLGITVEPEGGSSAPTTPRLMGGEL